MARLVAFNNISLDGLFADPDGGLAWAHQAPTDPEFDAFVADNAQGGGALLLGRRTYDMMAGFWPTQAAARMNPAVAERMNGMRKYVPSRTLAKADWSNTTLLQGDLAGEVRALKAGGGADLAILGSGSLVSQLAQAGLIDEVQLVLNPVVLGRGRPMFREVLGPLAFKLVSVRSFAGGKVFLRYAPA